MNPTRSGLQGLALCLLVGIAGCASGTTPTVVDAVGAPQASKDQIVVTVAQKRPGSFRLYGAPGRPYQRRGNYGGSLATEGVLDELADDYALTRVDGWHISSLGVYCEVFQVPPGRSVTATVNDLNTDARVDSAQLMNVFSVLAPSHQLGTSDPLIGMQPSIRVLQIEAAHRWARGDGITIAVIDTGVDREHPELAQRVIAFEDFVGDDAQSAEMDIHGTAVAGVIASQANNGIGIVGVAPEVDLIALRACWPVRQREPAANCSSFTLAKALESAIANHVDVINLSLAGPADPLLARLVDAALSRGTLVVSAIDPSDKARRFPASLPGVISVQVSDAAWQPGADPGEPYFSVVAPGTRVLTTTPDGNFGFLSGSSIAAAHVSGIGALLLQRAPDLTPYEIASLLARSVYRIDEMQSVSACMALAELLNIAGCITPELPQSALVPGRGNAFASPID